MNKILLILSILITFSFTAEAQDLNNKMNSVLKEKAIKKIDEKKKSEVKTEEPKTDNNQTLVNPTSNDNMKKNEIVSTPPIVKDSVPPLSATDSLMDARSRIILLATQVDTLAIDKMEWDAKKYLNVQNRPEDYWQKELSFTDLNSYKTQHVLDTSYVVFGWHPHWMGNAYQNYNFSLLSYVAYFSYEVDPQTGLHKSVHNWQSTALIDSAHKHNTKVLLTISNFGAQNNEIFLTNKNGQQKALINNLITLLRERNGDGVCIDFEVVPTKYKNQFTNFIIDLSRSLKMADSKFKVVLTVPAKDFRNVFDLKSLDNHIDLFVIMGYVYYGKFSKVAGPIAPLTSGEIWWELTVEKTVLEYKASGIKSKKFILGLPYYGAEWQTKDLTFPSQAQGFTDYYTYREIRRKFHNIAGQLDEHSKSMYQVYRGQNGKYYQVWYEDTTSLGLKYDLIKANQFGGVGIWALGYDNGYPDLWKLLANKFAFWNAQIQQLAALEEEKKEGSGFKKVMKFIKKAAKNPMAVLTSPGPLIKLLAGMFGGFLITLLVVMKMAKKMKKTMMVGAKGGMIGMVFAMIVIVTLMMKFLTGNEVKFLFIGFFIGAIILFMLTYKYIIRDKDLP